MRAMMDRPPGPFSMLNLYRLHEVADYSANPEFAPPNPISGRDLFDRYAASMDSLLASFDAKRVFLAEGAGCLIGPPDERWDVVQIVRYPSLSAFLSLTSSDEMLADMPHRLAMFEDSRVIPLIERTSESA